MANNDNNDVFLGTWYDPAEEETAVDFDGCV